MRSTAVVLVIATLVALGCDSPSNPPGSPKATDPDGRTCREARTVAEAAIGATVVNPELGRDSCYQEAGQLIYEVFAATRSEPGKPAHFKFTFHGQSVQSGVKELCQDARTGVWECGP